MQNILTSYLNLLKIKHTKSFSNRHFNEHPHKYNLYGISKMLRDYGIENAGVKIDDKEKDIFRIELPFIAHIQTDFVVVYKIENNNVFYIWHGKEINVSIDNFLQMWSGIVLLTETNEKSIEPNYREHKRKKILNIVQYTALITSVLSLLIAVYITNKLFSNIGLNILLSVNIVGVIICCLLVMKQMSFHGEYVDKICSLFNKNDCNNVLESKASKLWGIFGWSEIGFGYFLANVIIILFLQNFIPYLAFINLLTLPYAFWSVWYQKFKAKQWCGLCLITQVILWLIFVVDILFSYFEIENFDIIYLLSTLCIYSVAVFGINLLVPKLAECKKTEQMKYEINSIKADDDVFKILLKKQPYYEVSKEDSELIFGNENATLQIAILTNPYCNPCAKMHKRVEKLLQDTNNNICIKYILSAFNADLENINRYFIAVYKEKGEKEALKIFGEWFEKGKPRGEEFFKQFLLDISSEYVENEFKKHELWKEKTQIRATPTILVNGYQLPENYQIEDLQWFVNCEID